MARIGGVEPIEALGYSPHEPPDPHYERLQSTDSPLADAERACADNGYCVTLDAKMTAGAASRIEKGVRFGCSRCGACCNSNPQLSLPELFRHQDHFIGCLAIRRVAPSWFGSAQRFSDEVNTFFSNYAHAVAHGAGRQYVFVSTQAYNDPLSDKCAALTEDNLCSLQLRGKPLACRSVPLEAALPDSVQFSIMVQRARDAKFMGANCIRLDNDPDIVVDEAGRHGTSSGLHLPVVIEDTRVVDSEALAALELRREALRMDRLHWGETVFQLLRRDLFDHPERLSQLPDGGFLCMSLAPTLSVVSSLSNALSRRVLEYLSAQIELIALTVGPPVAEPTQAQRELSGMLRAAMTLRSKLQTARPLPQSAPRAAAVEAWLAAHTPEAADGPFG